MSSIPWAFPAISLLWPILSTGPKTKRFRLAREEDQAPAVLPPIACALPISIHCPTGLIFERFLNIERKSMPDFDIDFCQERRGEVIDYVRQKYGGNDHVAQIITYGSMKARGAIRDVGRALDIPFGDVDKIAKLVPDQLKMTHKRPSLKNRSLPMQPTGIHALPNCSRFRKPWKALPATPRLMPPALLSLLSR